MGQSPNKYESNAFKQIQSQLSNIALTFGLVWWAAGDMSCCRICFFSAAFFLVGVELFRFLRGDGVPLIERAVTNFYN